MVCKLLNRVMSYLMLIHTSICYYLVLVFIFLIGFEKGFQASTAIATFRALKSDSCFSLVFICISSFLALSGVVCCTLNFRILIFFFFTFIPFEFDSVFFNGDIVLLCDVLDWPFDFCIFE